METDQQGQQRAFFQCKCRLGCTFGVTLFHQRCKLKYRKCRNGLIELIACTIVSPSHRDSDAEKAPQKDGSAPNNCRKAFFRSVRLFWTRSDIESVEGFGDRSASQEQIENSLAVDATFVYTVVREPG